MSTTKTFLIDFQYFMPTKIIFQIESIKKLASLAINLGGKPCIVTGKQSSKINGALSYLLDRYSNAVVFDEVEENPTTDTCEKASQICKDNKCDWVIGVGGGSPVDVSKVVAGLANNDGPCEQYFGKDLFKKMPLPILAIPTTSGTGSEVTPYAVIVNRKANAKQTITDFKIFPIIALLDPSLTLTLPKNVTLSTCLDALSQSMEGIVSKKATPITDYLAVKSCKLISQWLPIVLDNPDDINARYWLLYASMLSGIVIAQTGTTLVHALGYYYTLNYRIPHGIANALFLIPMFKRNAKWLPEKVKTIVETIGGIFNDNDPEQSIANVLKYFFEKINFPYYSVYWGVSSDKLKMFSEDIYKDKYRFRNQYGIFTVEDLYKIFNESWNEMR
ncbi:MAG TPA: iron-containing alcohol dehydrogenase [Candidatus Hydrogenedens sp.]|nr:iron-containing alcohol dehydrogenase [Candidatus Hydrogenedens sp.]